MAVKHGSHVRQVEPLHNEPADHKESQQHSSAPHRQPRAPAPPVRREHDRQEEAGDGGHKGAMDQEPSRPREVQDMVHALHRLLGEEGHGEQHGDRRGIGGDRRGTGQPAPHSQHGRAVRQRDGDQESLVDHG